MLLFDDERYSHFLNPLSSRNRKVYYECIQSLIEKSRNVPLLYETDARDTLILYFRNCNYALVEEDVDGGNDRLGNNQSETDNASAVLRYFRYCGWLSERELGRNGDNIATVDPYCRKLIDAIERIFNRDNSAALSNQIFMIYDILHSAFNEDHARTHRPYSNILEPVSDAVGELKNELLTLKDSIRTIMRVVISLSETNDLGQFMLKDTMMQKFFSDYFFIKKDGMIPGYIGEIEKMLVDILNTKVYERMIEELQEMRGCEYNEAYERVNGLLDEIRSFISYDYEKDMDYIDHRINTYYQLYSSRILMVLSNGVNLQSYLNDILMFLKQADEETRNLVLEKLGESFELQSYKYVGRKSIERRRKRKENRQSAAITSSILSMEEKAELTRQLLYEYPDRFGIEQAAAYFDALLGDKDVLEPDESMIRTRDDVMMIVSAIIYSDSDGFPFTTAFKEGYVDTPLSRISRTIIKRRGK